MLGPVFEYPAGTPRTIERVAHSMNLLHSHLSQQIHTGTTVVDARRMFDRNRVMRDQGEALKVLAERMGITLVQVD
jgi:hypothetical protein